MNANELRAAAAALLVALKLKDKGTRDHSVRVARVSVLIGRAMALPRAQLLPLYYGALLHDVGKVFIYDRILKKPGGHTQIERMHMRQHVPAGRDALCALNMPIRVIEIVAQHHERFDGTGYPLGFQGVEIPLGARIVAVADAYDAITNNRCYRAGRSYQAAAAALTRGSGTQFDSEVVQAFFRVPEKQLVGDTQ